MADKRLPGILLPAVTVGDEVPDFQLPAAIAGTKKPLRLRLADAS